MMLPCADALIVERDKITDYLLNPAHRYGASKARFFAALAFGPRNGKPSPLRFGNTAGATL